MPVGGSNGVNRVEVLPNSGADKREGRECQYPVRGEPRSGWLRLARRGRGRRCRVAVAHARIVTLRGSRRAPHSGNAAVVAVGQFLQRSASRATSGGLSLLCRVREGGRPICFPSALARLLPSAVRVRIRSRSTSASPPSTLSIKRPVLVPVSAHGSANDRN